MMKQKRCSVGQCEIKGPLVIMLAPPTSTSMSQNSICMNLSFLWRHLGEQDVNIGYQVGSQ